MDHIEIEKYFGKLVEQAGDAVFTVGKALTILSWNQGSTDLLGYTREDVIGHSVDLLSPFEDKRHMRAMAIEVFDEGALKNLECEMMRKDGHTVSTYLTVSPVADENENVIAVSFIAKDITDQNRLLIHLIERQRQAGQLEALIESLTTISHHIRNAAAVISAKAEVSRELDELKHYRMLAGTCLRETKRIVAVIESLNEMVREVQISGEPLETIQMAGAPGPVYDIEARMQERLKKMNDPPNS